MYYPKGKGRADRIVRRLAVPQAFGDDLLKSYNVQFNGTDIMGTFILTDILTYCRFILEIYGSFFH